MVNPSATLSQLVAESGWLRRLALALVKDEAAADDLVHDTYVVAATQLPTDGRPVRPWLARVLWNRVRMRSRSGQRRRAREQAFGELAASPARPDDIVDHIKLQRLLAGLVLELAPAQRDVLLLHYFEGMTSSQIGARLDIPPGTVRWRLKQAIDELRTRLEERSPNRAWVPALAGFGRGAKTALVPKLLVIAFVAIAIFAVVLHSEVRAVATGAPSRAVAHEKRRPALPAEDDPSSPTAARAAASLRGMEQVFGAEQRRVEGKVIDQADRPVEGAEVEVHCGFRDDAPAAKQATSSRGGFAFDIDPQCRPYVTAMKGPLRGMTGWFSRTGMTIRLRRVPQILVRVLDAQTAAPIVGATVSGTWEFLDTTSVTTRADGVAQLDMELPGHIAIDAPHYVHAHRKLDDPEHPDLPIILDDGKRADSTTQLQLDVRLNRGVVVGGAVLDPDGNPVPGANVGLLGHTGADVASAYAKTDVAGRFETRVPAAGRYALTADGRRLTMAGPVFLDVPADGRTNVVARLVRRGEIHGLVVDLGGHPVAGALVSVDDGRFRPVIADPSGGFTIDNVDGALDLIAHRGSNASAFQHVQVGLGERVDVTMQVGPTGISGTAVDRAGQPVAGAYVWLNYCCEHNPSLVSGTGVTTDTSGAFSFDVPRGDFVLSVKRDDDDDYLADDDVKVTAGSHDVRVVVP